MGRVLVIRDRQTSHQEARKIAEETNKVVRYWPFFPRLECHTAYPPPSPRLFDPYEDEPHLRERWNQ